MFNSIMTNLLVVGALLEQQETLLAKEQLKHINEAPLDDFDVTNETDNNTKALDNDYTYIHSGAPAKPNSVAPVDDELPAKQNGVVLDTFASAHNNKMNETGLPAQDNPAYQEDEDDDDGLDTAL